MKLRIYYQVSFATTIEIEKLDDLEDGLCDIDIPENDDNEYQRDSFSSNDEK